MENFTLTIELGNADMDEAGLARALEIVAMQVRDGRTAARVIDGNGNKVGEWQIS